MVTDRVGPTITTLKAEVDFLSDELRQAKADNERLRAALRQVAAYKADDDEMDWADAVLTMNAIARAALEGK